MKKGESITEYFTSSMSIDELQSSLLVHEHKFKRLDQQEDQVLKVSVEGGSRGRGGRFPSRGRCWVWCMGGNRVDVSETKCLTG